MKNMFPHRQRISSIETKNKNFETSRKISSIKKRATDSVACCNIICSSYQLLEEYYIQTADDIQENLKNLLGGTIKELLE